MKPRRVALIFPPGIIPSSPPLGLAQLKAYLHEVLPGIHVRLFDLGLAHYEQALRWIEDNRLRMRLKGCDAASSRESILHAAGLFKGSRGLEEFLQLERYDESASVYRSFETMLNGLFDHASRRLLAGLPVPETIRQYLRELLQPVRAFRPDLIGFSLLFSQQLYHAMAMAKELKSAQNRVVVGGATLSVMPHPEVLLSDRVTMDLGGRCVPINLSAFVDYLLVGEGEVGLAALLQNMDGDLSRVPGLMARGREPIEKRPTEAVKDLDQLPVPDFSDFPLASYHAPRLVLPFLASRSCFWKRCAFCTHQQTYLNYREERPETTVAKLATLMKTHDVRLVSLVDEMIHPNRFGRLSALLARIEPGLRYSAYAKPVSRFDLPLLEKLYRSGARVIMWGVESGSQRVLDAMRKGTRTEDMERVLRDSHRAGIWNLLFVLFGFPSETRAEWEETLAFLERHRDRIDALSRSRFVLLAGSRVYENPDGYGIRGIRERAERDPVSIAYDYEVDSGLSQDQVTDFYGQEASRLRTFGRSPYFGMYRDHMLIHASCG